MARAKVLISVCYFLARAWFLLLLSLSSFDFELFYDIVLVPLCVMFGVSALIS